MEIKNKGKSDQVVWGIWEDAYQGFIPRELKIIETVDKLINGDKVYHLICKTNKVNVYTTGERLFSTRAEAQAECNRKNKGGGMLYESRRYY